MAHQHRNSERRSEHGTVIDPVCGMSVDPSTTAVSREYEDVTYYFCSAHCVENFDADPARYAPAS